MNACSTPWVLTFVREKTVNSESQNENRKPSKEEIIAAIKRCAAKIGHAPSQTELKTEIDVKTKTFRRLFGSYTKAVQACGLERRGSGHRINMKELFEEWARMVRETGKVPSVSEYGQRSAYSIRPLTQRYGSWSFVAEGMAQYAETNALAEPWADVLEIARKYSSEVKGAYTLRQERAQTSRPRVRADRPLCGAPFLRTALGFAPVNEMGVVFLFGAMADRLGFLVTFIGTQFPDVEAYREVAPGRWQWVRIEIEYQSRNFLHHSHDPKGCDLIVCWENNWPGCPMEVIELKGAFAEIASIAKIG
jgi:Homing endonuclease associated repeat